MKIKKVIISVLSLFLVFSLAGCGNENTSELLKEKVTEEVSYLDNKIIAIANVMNGINLQNYKIETREVPSPESKTQQSEQSTSSGTSSEQSAGGEQTQSEEGASDKKVYITEMKTTSILVNGDNEIDWDSIKAEVELLYSTWDTIILDLYKLNITSDLTNEFSAGLNDVTLALKKEDKSATLNALSKLYEYLPKFLEYASNQREDVAILTTKQHVLNAYSTVDDGNWDDMTSEINVALDNFTPVITNLEYGKGKEHTINRIYVILNELKNSLSSKDKEIFLINYKNLINEINTL